MLELLSEEAATKVLMMMKDPNIEVIGEITYFIRW